MELLNLRQITAFYGAGDIPDLHSMMQPEVSSSLRGATECEVVRIPHSELRAITGQFPGLIEAFWRYTVWAASVAAEWVANIGVRSGPQGIAHLICELAFRSGERTDFIPPSPNPKPRRSDGTFDRPRQPLSGSPAQGGPTAIHEIDCEYS